MDWVAIKPALKTLLGNLSGLVTVWKDEPRPMTPNGADKALCLLSLAPTSGQGFDERGRIYDATQPLNREMQEVLIGVRNVTLSVRVESFDQSHSKTALHYLEHVRARFRWKTTTAALKAINVAFRGTHEIIDLSGMKDQRIASMANLDIKLGMVSVEANPSRGGYIETVDLDITC